MVAKFLISVFNVDITFDQEVTEGDDVEMKCSYTSSTAFKIVTWYRKVAELEDFVNISESTLTVPLEEKFEESGKFQAVVQSNFVESHKIMLTNATVKDTGVYYCSVNIFKLHYESARKQLHVDIRVVEVDKGRILQMSPI